MTSLARSLEKLAKAGIREPKEDEYLNPDDGLIYCAKCRTPRQHRANLMGQAITPTVPCKCQQEAWDREAARQARQDFLDKVARMKASGLQDRALYDYRFAKDTGCSPALRHAHTYVDRWEEMKENNTGLLLWGDMGTGKTFFAECIANALLEQCVPVLMTNFARILGALSGLYAGDRNAYVDSLNRYDLLILDDLGAERTSDFALEQIFHVIDSRCRCGKPLIVTTNLTLKDLQSAADLAHRRIYDRILERCVPICINGRNLRAENARAQMKRARALFS